MRSTIVLALLGGLVLAGGTACNSITGPDGDRVVGIIRWEAASTSGDLALAVEAGPLRVLAPDTVTAGEPFQVQVQTYGLSGCWENAGEEVSVDGAEAVITPYDRVVEEVDGEPVLCTQALKPLEHTVELTFHEPGDGTLRIDGRYVRGLDGTTAEPAEHEVTVTIEPAG